MKIRKQKKLDFTRTTGRSDVAYFLSLTNAEDRYQKQREEFNKQFPELKELED